MVLLSGKLAAFFDEAVHQRGGAGPGSGCMQAHGGGGEQGVRQEGEGRREVGVGFVWDAVAIVVCKSTKKVEKLRFIGDG